jgi:hypothetical protein
MRNDFKAYITLSLLDNILYSKITKNKRQFNNIKCSDFFLISYILLK